MAIEITDEMRRAVLDEMCALEGHVLNINTAIGRGPQGQEPMSIRARNEDELPHIACSRCGKTWLVVEEPGEGYEAAEAALQSSLKATDDLSKRITEIRNRRKKKP